MVAVLGLYPLTADAMHIMEGFLPAKWCVVWYALFIPFFISGIIKLNKTKRENPGSLMILALAAAFIFIMSSFKIPSVTGSSSHVTGIAFGAILFGVARMSVLGTIVLLFQTLLLAHGGLTTLGANAMSMAVVGAVTAVFVFKSLRKFNVNFNIAVFAAAFLSDLATYLFTSVELALAFSGNESFSQLFVKFLSVFSLTQIPLAIVEGLVTALLLKLLMNSVNLKEYNIAIQ